MMPPLVLVLTLLQAVKGQIPQFGQQYGLDGTYYGVQTPYAQGHCSFQFGNSYPLPWTTGVSVPLALNAPQYADSTPCGMCIQYRGTGTGSGFNPIQADQWKFGIITDECPECLSGSLDLAIDGDGRWQVEWIPVQCNVGTSSFVYSLQGSNKYYIKLFIGNTRVPVQSVSLNGIQMSKTIDNYWLATASSDPGFTFPLPITLTSLLGDTVSDTIPASLGFPDGTATGAAQFPISCSYASVQPDGVLPLSGQPNTAGAQACPIPGNTPTAPQAGSPPPAATAPPAPQSTPASIAPPVATNTPMPVPTPVSTPSPTPPATPTATPSSVNQSCTSTIPLNSQCGGEGGQCAIQGRSLNISNCVDGQWVGTCCESGAFCQRLQRFVWQCSALDTANTTYREQSGPIPSLYQCGGLGTCPRNLCGDRQWDNTSCTSGSTCTRYDRNYWQCRPLPFSVPVPPLLPPIADPLAPAIEVGE